MTLDNPLEPKITGETADYRFKKMPKYTNFTNNYIPKYVPWPETLPWYEKDFSYHLDLDKVEKFRDNTNNHFKTTKVVNVYIIHKQCRGEKVPDGNQKDCKTIKEKDVS